MRILWLDVVFVKIKCYRAYFSWYLVLVTMIEDNLSFCLQVVEPGKRAWRKIREKFGDEVFNEDGTLNRPKLGKIIFENAAKRQDLNRITHPEIFREMCWEIIYNFFRGKTSWIFLLHSPPNQ